MPDQVLFALAGVPLRALVLARELRDSLEGTIRRLLGAQ